LALLSVSPSKKAQVHAVENCPAQQKTRRGVPPGRAAYFWMMPLFMRFAVTCEAEIYVEKLPTVEITNIGDAQHRACSEEIGAADL
jgi:hypothetical protein